MVKDEAVIRIRRCAARGLRRRARYEVEFLGDAGQVERRNETVLPVTVIDPVIGVAEAWALTREADRVWSRSPGEWTYFPPMISAPSDSR